MPDRPQDVVARGYDAGADRFAAWQRQITGSTRLERLDELLELLPGRPDVLELGSGAGVRSTRLLGERSQLLGVDISAEQVRRARERVPNAEFRHADFTEIELEAGSFNAVVAFYVFNHVPREELGPLLGRITVWLQKAAGRADLVHVKKTALALAVLSLCLAPAVPGATGGGLSSVWRVYSGALYYGAGGNVSMPPNTRQLVINSGSWTFGSSHGAVRVSSISAADWKRWGIQSYGPKHKATFLG